MCENMHFWFPGLQTTVSDLRKAYGNSGHICSLVWNSNAEVRPLGWERSLRGLHLLKMSAKALVQLTTPFESMAKVIAVLRVICASIANPGAKPWENCAGNCG
jgi:hypothetical protein